MRAALFVIGILLIGCDAEPPESGIRESVGDKHFYTATLQDGTRCVWVASVAASLQCQFPEIQRPEVESPESRRLRFADCVNGIDPDAPNLSTLIADCHGGIHESD